jgi:hypothetical protein
VSRRLTIRILILSAVLVLCLVVGTVLWVNAEAVEPRLTHFPLKGGAQQALLACSAGYALLDRSEAPISVVQNEADQAAQVDVEFLPLAVYAAQGLTIEGTQRDFTSFCVTHHMWP